MSETSTLLAYESKITREQLAEVPTPPATRTHVPIPHDKVVETLVETLSFRHIGVVGEEYAVPKHGMRMFGIVDLESSFDGCRFAIGVRNSHDKSFRLSLTVGLRVFVCENLAFSGDFTPVLAKHTKNFSLEDAMSIGVDRMQRNFEPMKRQVEEWRARQLSVGTAKLIIYQAFVEGDLEAPKHLARKVHDLYFDPQYPEFQPRTMWSLSNAFTSAFKRLDRYRSSKRRQSSAGFYSRCRDDRDAVGRFRGGGIGGDGEHAGRADRGSPLRGRSLGTRRGRGPHSRREHRACT